MKDIMDLHTHTIASGHAYNTLYEMVQAAAGAGLSLFGSSDHAPGLPGAQTRPNRARPARGTRRTPARSAPGLHKAGR